ncbi:hypothetical protein KAT51_08015, partial [bacterium]|nr:hypothetical protein [bacterium]
YLVCGDLELLWGNNIPDLTDQHAFDCMRFAFANACFSGWTCFWPWVANLHDGFIDNGCEAYFGWDDTVNDEEAYEYAIYFYDFAISTGCTVSHARAVTENELGTPGANSIIFGDLGVKLTP